VSVSQFRFLAGAQSYKSLSFDNSILWHCLPLLMTVSMNKLVGCVCEGIRTRNYGVARPNTMLGAAWILLHIYLFLFLLKSKIEFMIVVDPVQRVLIHMS
jgi:hypothetical protein